MVNACKINKIQHGYNCHENRNADSKWNMLAVLGLVQPPPHLLSLTPSKKELSLSLVCHKMSMKIIVFNCWATQGSFSSHPHLSYVLQGGPRHSCRWLQVATVSEIPWPSSGSPLRLNLVSHARSFVPPTAQLWNSLPAQIPAIRLRASFSREVNRFLGATSSAASKWYFRLCC